MTQPRPLASLFFAFGRNYITGITAHLFGSTAPSGPRRGLLEDPFSARFQQVARGDTTPAAPAPDEDRPEPDESELDLPQTFVACRCGHLNPLFAVECGAPHPRHLARLVRCSECGGEDAGPWLVRDGRMLCERCADRSAA